MAKTKAKLTKKKSDAKPAAKKVAAKSTDNSNAKVSAAVKKAESKMEKLIRSGKPGSEYVPIQLGKVGGVYISITWRVRPHFPKPGDTYCVYRILPGGAGRFRDMTGESICMLCTGECDPSVIFIETSPADYANVILSSTACISCPSKETYESY